MVLVRVHAILFMIGEALSGLRTEAGHFSIPANVFAKVWMSPGHRAET
jgi:hypothetical protein